MTGEWRGFGAKGQDLNVQLCIHSFILFKWLRWQSDLNISYTIKSLRLKSHNVDYTWWEMNRRFLNIIVTEIREQLNDLIKIKTEYGTIRCCSASEHLLNRPDSILWYTWHWQLLDLNSFDCAHFCISLCSKMCTSWNTYCSSVWR